MTPASARLTRVSMPSCVDGVPSGGCNPDAIVAEAGVTKVQGATVPFSLTLHLRGTSALRIATDAKHATIRIQGAWPTPSFTGTDLPVSSAVTSGGFEAEWIQDRIGQPRYVKGATISGADANGSVVGVDLIESAPVYRTITRGSKYGLLIVALAFAAYFLFEVATGVVVGLFQYGLLGASLSLFMLLLLSISEIAGFDVGYATSAFLVKAQASLYTVSITRRPGLTAIFAAMLAAVFGFFYVLLGLESYALVIGAARLFLILSIIMGVTQVITPPGSAIENVHSE